MEYQQTSVRLSKQCCDLLLLDKVQQNQRKAGVAMELMCVYIRFNIYLHWRDKLGPSFFMFFKYNLSFTLIHRFVFPIR